jgi:hypothetical protein
MSGNYTSLSSPLLALLCVLQRLWRQCALRLHRACEWYLARKAHTACTCFDMSQCMSLAGSSSVPKISLHGCSARCKPIYSQVNLIPVRCRKTNLYVQLVAAMFSYCCSTMCIYPYDVLDRSRCLALRETSGKPCVPDPIQI